MRRLFLMAWLLIPVAAGAYHYGPGQDHLRNDEVARLVHEGRRASDAARAIAEAEGEDAARGEWANADEAYTQALQRLSPERKQEALALRVERAKAREFTGKLFEATAELEEVVAEIQRSKEADPALLRDARNALANAQYYSTWLMRLEGAPREEWSRKIEASRQNYKLLATEAADRRDMEVARVAEVDLEAAIRLERMSLEDLQGLPLPSQ